MTTTWSVKEQPPISNSLRIIGINDCIDEVLSKAPLETDHGHHVDENGWLKGKLNER
jgi:hypothetical protein